ncbi:MAG: asparagine synthase (glutamine-hydrolyzing) [Acidobacteriota bacterium]
MCGIAGYLSRSRYPDAVLVGMTRQLVHRGPDAEGYYCDGPVALGHRRLSILDIAGSPQPMSTPDGSLTCVFNGEIYNFAALRESLSRLGHVLHTRGDTEVLLYAYREYGTAMLEQLQGMFAFALWDKPNQRLFIARDHLGVKPLYYHWDNALFIFGSELKAVTAHPAVPRELDLNALGLYLQCQYIPAPRSVYRGVHKLDAGHALMIDNGALRTWEYWRPDYSDKFQFDETEARSRLKVELRSSVERMLVADVPLGSFLSGGIDSSLISALMVEITGKPIETFNLGFHGETTESEHVQAQAVARHIGSNHHF